MNAKQGSSWLLDFSQSAEVKRWSAVNDGVMGGRSQSAFSSSAAGHGLFHGQVSLADGGGFASVRRAPAPLGWLGAGALRLRVRGDGKRYQLRMRTPESQHELSYLAPFESLADEWCELDFSPGDFRLTRRGQLIEGAPRLAFEQVESVGLLIADRQAGAFALELAWLARA